MIKAIIVKKNKVQKIVVTKSLESAKLSEGESIHEITPGESFRPGDKHKSIWERFKGAVGLK